MNKLKKVIASALLCTSVVAGMVCSVSAEQVDYYTYYNSTQQQSKTYVCNAIYRPGAYGVRMTTKGGTAAGICNVVSAYDGTVFSPSNFVLSEVNKPGYVSVSSDSNSIKGKARFLIQLSFNSGGTASTSGYVWH